jgi:hypothetical protein
MRGPIAILLASSMACAGAGGAPEAEVAVRAPAEGKYDYIANLPGQQVRGTLSVVGDTIIVDPMADYCRPTVRTPDPLAIHYTCNGPGSFEQIYLRIDRRNPAQLSKWSATYRVQRQRDVCAQYAIRDGRQVCVLTKTEMYETTESRTGNLQVRKLP